MMDQERDQAFQIVPIEIDGKKYHYLIDGSTGELLDPDRFNELIDGFMATRKILSDHIIVEGIRSYKND